MANMFKELTAYWELLGAFTIRNIQIKYKQTFMGFLWALFMPMIIVMSGIVVKIGMAKIAGNDVQTQEIASVSVKALPWAFFIGALKFSVGSLVGNMNIVKKIYFPRIIFPLSYTISQMFDFFVAAVAFAVFLTVIKIGLSVYLWYLPVLIIFLFLFTLGLSILFACGNLFYRDVKYIVDVVLTFAIFFTPVFYDASLFGKWETVLLLSPIACILEGLNDVIVLHQAPDLFWFTYAGVWSIVAFFGSYWIFKKAEPVFADNI